MTNGPIFNAYSIKSELTLSIENLVLTISLIIEQLVIDHLAIWSFVI